jgi:hypothetical protein
MLKIIYIDAERLVLLLSLQMQICVAVLQLVPVAATV